MYLKMAIPPVSLSCMIHKLLCFQILLDVHAFDNVATKQLFQAGIAGCGRITDATEPSVLRNQQLQSTRWMQMLRIRNIGLRFCFLLLLCRQKKTRKVHKENL